jgi:hypothetical protein
VYNIFIVKKTIKTPPLGLEPRIFRLEVGRVIQLRHEGLCIIHTPLNNNLKKIKL